MRRKQTRSDWLFNYLTPNQLLKASLIAAIVCLVIGLSCAAFWLFNRNAPSSVSYAYKPTTAEEYLEKNGNAVLFYSKTKNEMTLALSEDLINTALQRYLDDQGNRLGGYHIYEMVFRQTDNAFYINMQSGLFRVSLKLDAAVCYNAAARTFDFTVTKMTTSEENNILVSHINAPQLEAFSVPADALPLPTWAEPQALTLNANEMLLVLKPDIDQVKQLMKTYLETNEVYLDWNDLQPDAVDLKKLTAGEVIDMVVTHQEKLPDYLALLSDEACDRFFEKYNALLTSFVTHETVRDQRKLLQRRMQSLAAKELLATYESRLQAGVRKYPAPTTISFASGDVALRTYEDPVQLNPTVSEGVKIGEIPSIISDSGIIFDYNSNAFITTEALRAARKSKLPHVEEIGDCYCYFDFSTQKPVILVAADDSVLVLTAGTESRMSLADAQSAYPNFDQAPESASVLTGGERYEAIASALQQQNGETTYLRLVRASSDYAFVIFSTEAELQTLCSAVMSKRSDEWRVDEYDVTSYPQYITAHPTINATIFPVENISAYTTWTALDKQSQQRINALAGSNAKMDRYYFINEYLYVHFSNGRELVYRVNEENAIIESRNYLGALAHWKVPALFPIQPVTQASESDEGR